MATISKSAACSTVTGTISYTYTYTITTTETQVTLNITKRAWTKVTGVGLRGQIFINNNRITWQTIYQNHSANSGSDDISLTVNMSRTTTARSWPLRIDLDEVTGTSAETAQYISKGSTTVTVDVPALEMHTVTYNGNGGTGVPSEQSALKSAAITLSSVVPVRPGYRFLYWHTKSSGTGGTTYYPGNTFAANAASATLYAIWEKAVTAVTFGRITAIRTATAVSTDEADEGEFAYVQIPYTISGEASALSSIEVEVDPDELDFTLDHSSATKPETGEIFADTVILRASDCSVNSKYVFTVTITVSNTVTGSTQSNVVVTKGVILPSAFFVIDVKAGGHGIHFGGAAVEDGFWVGMPAYFTGEAVTFSDTNLYYKFTNIDGRIGQIAPSPNIYWEKTWVTDKNGRLIHFEEGAWRTDNSFSITYGLRRHSPDYSSSYQNYFSLSIDNNGDPSVALSSPAAWRTALSAVNKSGDTMSGDLTISRSTATDTYLRVKNSLGNVLLDVGSTGNHGVYSSTHSKWLLYANSSGNVYLNGFNFTDASSARSAIGAVNKAGDTMSGNLTIQSTGPVFYVDNTSVNASLANNNRSSTCWNGLVVRDTSGRTYGAAYGFAQANGITGMGLWAYNYGTSGSQVGSAAFQIAVDKSGTVSYSLTNAAAFRNALGASNGIFPASVGGTGTATGIKGWTAILSSITDTTARTIDISSYTDIAICAAASGTSYRSSVVFPRVHFSTSLCEIYLGGWGNNSTTSNRRGVCKMSTTQFQVVGCRVDNQDVTGTWYLYGR